MVVSNRASTTALQHIAASFSPAVLEGTRHPMGPVLWAPDTVTPRRVWYCRFRHFNHYHPLSWIFAREMRCSRVMPCSPSCWRIISAGSAFHAVHAVWTMPFGGVLVADLTPASLAGCSLRHHPGKEGRHGQVECSCQCWLGYLKRHSLNLPGQECGMNLLLYNLATSYRQT